MCINHNFHQENVADLTFRCGCEIPAEFKSDADLKTQRAKALFILCSACTEEYDEWLRDNEPTDYELDEMYLRERGLDE